MRHKRNNEKNENVFSHAGNEDFPVQSPLRLTAGAMGIRRQVKNQMSRAYCSQCHSLLCEDQDAWLIVNFRDMEGEIR